MSMIKLSDYDVLKLHFKNEEDARVLVDYIETKYKETVTSSNVATKTDIKELELKIEQTKSDSMKWTIGMFLALALMVIGLYFIK